MKRNLVLLIVPPVIALGLLTFSHEPEQKGAPAQIKPNIISEDKEAVPTQAQIPNTPSIIRPNEQSQVAKDTEQTNTSPLTPIEQIRAIKNKTALHQAVLKDHESFARYPSDNVRFERLERDPVSMAYETNERTTESDDGTASITAWTDKKYLLQGESVQLSARVNDAGSSGVKSKMMSAVYANETLSLGTFELTDQDGNGTYTLTLTSEQTAEWPIGIYKALIASDLKNLSESVSFVISPPVIELTGEYRERITAEGNLLFEIEVKTTEAARYYVRASLYTGANTPIGSAQFADNLSTGRQWIPLTYFGLMIRDNNEPGPYLIQTVELAKAGIPMLRMPPAQTNMFTQSYALDEFNNQTYQEQQSLK